MGKSTNYKWPFSSSQVLLVVPGHHSLGRPVVPWSFGPLGFLRRNCCWYRIYLCIPIDETMLKSHAESWVIFDPHVHLCLSRYMYWCIHHIYIIYIYIYTYIYTYVYVYIYVHIHMYIYICICVSICICICICIFIFIFIFIFICRHIRAWFWLRNSMI